MYTRSTPDRHRWLRWLPYVVAVVAVIAVPLALRPAASSAAPSDESLLAGAEVYQKFCSACHQPGGVGMSGTFPPLVDNPNVEDAAHVEDVIRNGLKGEITVNGETYDGVMPPQAGLSDDDIVDVIAYIQSGFATPAAPAAPTDPVATTPPGPVAGTELPALANYGWILAMLIAVAAAALVFGPRIIGVQDRREGSWLDAWLKTAVIVVGAILLTVIIPAKVLETEAVAKLPRIAQDLIASGIWFAGLAALLWALWYAHRESRI